MGGAPCGVRTAITDRGWKKIFLTAATMNFQMIT